jgi:hypothetical protein
MFFFFHIADQDDTQPTNENEPLSTTRKKQMIHRCHRISFKYFRCIIEID